MDISRSLTVEVKEAVDTDRAKAEYPYQTSVMVTGNGYQWAGFTVHEPADLLSLKVAIEERLEVIQREINEKFNAGCRAGGLR